MSIVCVWKRDQTICELYYVRCMDDTRTKIPANNICPRCRKPIKVVVLDPWRSNFDSKTFGKVI